MYVYQHREVKSLLPLEEQTFCSQLKGSLLPQHSVSGDIFDKILTSNVLKKERHAESASLDQLKAMWTSKKVTLFFIPIVCPQSSDWVFVGPSRWVWPDICRSDVRIL